MPLRFLHLFFILSGTLLGAFQALASTPDFCKKQDVDLCSPADRVVASACEIEKKAAGCEEFLKLHPELKNSDKLRDCDDGTRCESTEKSQGFIKNCGLPAMKAVWDGVAGIYQILSGEATVPSEQDLAKLEFFKNCTDAACKRKMLGPFVSYFSKEEIEGHGETAGVNSADIANQNYIQGYSSAVLYRKLLQKLKKDFQTKGMNEKFIEPWSGEEAKLPHSFNELIDKVLANAGITHTTCYKPEVVWQMRCYALGSLVDPTILAGAGVKLFKIAGLAGKEVALLKSVPETPTRPLGSAARTSAVPGLDPATDLAVKQRLETTAIKDAKPIPFLDGVTGGYYVELSDGTKGVWKPDRYDGSSMHSEIAAYNIDRHLGLNSVPVTVKKEMNGQEGSLQIWVNKTQESKVHDPSHFVFYDYLIGNGDRHAGNYLIVNGKAVGIDNGTAFRTQTGIEDFPKHVDAIITEQKRAEKAFGEQKAIYERARRAGVKNENLRKMEVDLKKAEESFQAQKQQAAREIADLGVTAEAAKKLKSTSNVEWNRLMNGISAKDREEFFFRKKLAEDAVKKAEDYFGKEIYRDPAARVEFKRPKPYKERLTPLEQLQGSGL